MDESADAVVGAEDCLFLNVATPKDYKVSYSYIFLTPLHALSNALCIMIKINIIFLI